VNIENRLITEDIVKAVSGMLVNGDMGIVFKGISTDTRKLKPGYLFWALEGRKYDGHSFWKDAVEKGAKGLIISKFPEGFRLEELPKTISVILVKDTLQALGKLANWWRKELGAKVIAITGSCGKTTTKELTHFILSKFFSTAKSPGNFNNLIGVPLSLLSVKKGIEVVILELGTNSPGEIKILTKIVEPDVSVITCVYPSHLEGLKSFEGVLEEKISLFKNSPFHTIFIYNADQEVLRKKAEAFPNKKLCFGIEESADVKGEEIKCRDFCVEGRVRIEEEVCNLKLNLIGKHNFYNVLCALAIGKAFSLSLKEMVEVLEKGEPFQRMKVLKIGSFVVIDDTYNANPSSVLFALESLKDVSEEFGKKLVILGDMKELGEYAESFHREVGERVGEVADAGFFIGEMAEFYAEGFGTSQKPCETYKTVEEALTKLKLPFKKAVVLVKGSRALAMERIVEKLKKELG
jgi:UDP-N-acetylmuramoyl-tripeptide--D-alanyl-D-alanine ligase